MADILLTKGTRRTFYGKDLERGTEADLNAFIKTFTVSSYLPMYLSTIGVLMGFLLFVVQGGQLGGHKSYFQQLCTTASDYRSNQCFYRHFSEVFCEVGIASKGA